MTPTRRLVIRILLPLLISISLAGSASLFAGATAPSPKDLVGNWEGKFLVNSNEVGVRLELRDDGNKVVGELKTMHGNWTVTDVKFATGKWTITWRTPDNATGTMVGTLAGDKLEGNFDFPPNFAGSFSLARVKDAS
jgi:hypothetical protein